MKKLKHQNVLHLKGGSKSYGAGYICAIALVGTIAVTAASGPVGLISMGTVTGSACGFGIWAAWDE